MEKQSKIIYPMSMLREIVGNGIKVAEESKNFEFKESEPYFHYKEGEILESLTEELAEFSIKEMGFVKIAV